MLISDPNTEEQSSVLLGVANQPFLSHFPLASLRNLGIYSLLLFIFFPRILRYPPVGAYHCIACLCFIIFACVTLGSGKQASTCSLDYIQANQPF